MIDLDQLAATETRYGQRGQQRQATREMLEEGRILDVEGPERLVQRVERLSANRFSTSLPATVSMRETPTPALGDDFFERILGANNLLDVQFLQRGVQVSASVARIQIREVGGLIAGFGTGFLVSPRLLLTNNHVLSTAEEAAHSLAEFGFERVQGDSEPAGVTFRLVPDEFFVTDGALDYCLVAVAEQGSEGARLAAFGWCPLIATQGKILRGESLNMIQHPNGEPKMLSLRENTLIDLLEDFLHYETDTAPGSSGSPVLNDQWEVVGLHHSGVPRRDSQGQVLTRSGTVWMPGMSDTEIDWIANEGVRVSRILAHLDAQRLGSRQRELLAQLRDGRPPPSRSVPRAEPELADPQSSAGGPVTWTIPLRITVDLGDRTPGGSFRATSPTPFLPAASGNDVRHSVRSFSEQDAQEALRELQRAGQRPYHDSDADGRDIEAYYRDIDEDLSPVQLFDALSLLVTTSHKIRPRYKPATQLYPWIDLQPTLKLQSVYSGQEFEPERVILDDLRIDQERAAHLRERPSQESSGPSERERQELESLLEALLPFNCEHVVPQSWFDKDEPMRGDLHHLFTCERTCNSFRGNIPYFDFPEEEEVVRQGCGRRQDEGFEPSAGRGPAARATMYFLLRYPGEVNRAQEFGPERLATLVRWHLLEPPGVYERHRNAAIFAVQGNRNPLIDHPDWAERIDFLKGLG